MSQQNSKRRRVSLDQESLSVPDAVGSSTTPTTVADAAAFKLDEVPNLLLVIRVKDNAEDVITALKELDDILSYDNDDAGEDNPAVKKIQEATDRGALSLLVVTMRKWQRNQRIQKHACACLAWLLSRGGVAGRLFMARSGGTEAVVDAMKNSSDSELLVDAFDALKFACLVEINNEPEAVMDSIHKLVEKLDGIALVARAMKQCADGAYAQNAGLDFFWFLCTRCKFHDKLVKSGAALAATLVLEQHSDNEKLRKSATDFLSELFRGQEKE